MSKRLALLSLLLLSSCAASKPSASPPGHADLQDQPSAPDGPGRKIHTFIVETEVPCKTPGSISVSYPPYGNCFPVVEPAALAEPKNWARPLIISTLALVRWNRHLRCKAMHCSYPGAAFEDRNGLVIPIEIINPDAPWAAGEIMCDPRESKQGHVCTATLPKLPMDRRWMGMVLPYYEEGVPEPKLRYRVMAVEELKEDAHSP
jgi:hypothetical protein